MGWQTEVINDSELFGISLEPAGKGVPDAVSSLCQTGTPAVNTRFFGDPHHPGFAVSFVYRGVGLAHATKTTRTPTAPQDVQERVAPSE